jgi:hypothetical protein
MGLVIDKRRIQDLPQHSQDVLAFALLTTNVLTGPGRTGDLRINAGRNRADRLFPESPRRFRSRSQRMSGSAPLWLATPKTIG